MHRLALLALWAVTGAAHAAPLRLCTIDHPFPPHTNPDGSGQAQILLRRAAQESGFVIENSVAPRLRCIAQMKSGAVDAVFSAYLPDRTAWGVFPMAGAAADPARAVGVMRFIVYRQKGGTLQWDGRAFSGMDQRPVGVQTGLAVATQLREIGVPLDEGAKTIEQNLEKLVRGRVQAVVALEGETQPLIEHDYPGQIEALPKEFSLTPIYLHVRPGYYSQNREAVDKLWNAMRRLREGARPSGPR